MVLMVSLQMLVFLATLLTAIPTIVLAAYMTKKWIGKKQRSHLFWSAGLWLFAITVLMETLFSQGIYSSLLIDLYLLLVVILVEMLALGSIQLIKSKLYRDLYYAFTVIITAITAYLIFSKDQGNLIMNYVVAGQPSIPVIIASSVATFAAVIIIVFIAAISYRKTHNAKMISIITGVCIVSIAGTLYIASYPYLLYYAEFIGMALLWLGFV